MYIESMINGKNKLSMSNAYCLACVAGYSFIISNHAWRHDITSNAKQ